MPGRKVNGIEASANLDPNNATAFVTGLTFAAKGQFTGTMIPVAVPVPDPETTMLMLCGLGAIGVAARRRRATAPACA